MVAILGGKVSIFEVLIDFPRICVWSGDREDTHFLLWNPMSKWKAVHKQLLSLTSNSFLAVAKQFLSSSSMQMTVHLHSVAFMQISSP